MSAYIDSIIQEVSNISGDNDKESDNVIVVTKEVLTSILQKHFPDGWVVVPEEGHIDMDRAVTTGDSIFLGEGGSVHPRNLVRNILSAAPKPSDTY